VTETEVFDGDRVEAIAARLDLRQPNREALESVVATLAQHYDLDGNEPPFECVVDVATGVGKTYIMAAGIEYLAVDGVRDFAVVAPGRTILDKTVANFTPGSPKSLLGGMEVTPVVITSDNFATPAMRAAMDDPDQVKLYIFTVQALLKPETKVGRKTHKFQEGLGTAFYAHLQSLDRLVVFADEHHMYYGPKFSATVRELNPWALVGLTATPAKGTPPEQIVYRYPLAAAIADKLVKTPVVVGRKDDRSDVATKLLDGVRLLELKERAIARWCDQTGAKPVNPIMFVIAKSIEEAEETAAVAEDPGFVGGRYIGKVLTVHSDKADEALAELAKLEEDDNPHRIVVAVGMLKEGWDVKNVYVIASLRALVSELLTEQTLGRGLRLPFGEYTSIELLDTLEVLAHERYEDLLKKAGVLNEEFIDRRTRAIIKENAQGELVVVKETTETRHDVVFGDALAEAHSSESAVVQTVEDYTSAAEAQVAQLAVELRPREDVVPLKIPRLRMTAVESKFSLADITDHSAFRKLGELLAASPDAELRRTVLSARVVEGPDGLRRAEVVRVEAADKIESPPSLLPLEDLRSRLVDLVLTAPVVPARPQERAAVAPIIDAFIKGLGDDAAELLTSYFDRAAARLVRMVTEEARRFAAKPEYDDVVEIVELNKVRTGKPVTSSDRLGPFTKGVGYEGFKRSLYAQDWFDSGTERDAANIIDGASEVEVWVRLQLKDLPILWSSAGREYNPDFIVIEKDGSRWVVEIKMDKEMASPDVIGKREAAKRWAQHVSADPNVGVRWGYVLVSETDVKSATGSWPALRSLGVG
jgi:type III restriction enzyme